jgi:hypothetical protein
MKATLQASECVFNLVRNVRGFLVLELSDLMLISTAGELGIIEWANGERGE